MQDIAVQFEKHCWIHSVSLFPPQVHVGRSPIIKYRPEFSNNSLFHDIKDNILIHLNTNNSVKNIKENLILIGLKINKKKILKIEQRIMKIFKCNINKLNTNQEKEKKWQKKIKQELKEENYPQNKPSTSGYIKN
ncbi:hypothetical protein SHM_21610 [Spiroplasma ixodetis]|uniref:Uncharacterized protein n=1 Tax=Spiroplasma ixodetis TaxID=2141 RepID=A0ABM8BXC8_9MOLU|nr:hypothetical protein SHM_21610 [Spiroplasma ixodetis]